MYVCIYLYMYICMYVCKPLRAANEFSDFRNQDIHRRDSFVVIVELYV